MKRTAFEAFDLEAFLSAERGTDDPPIGGQLRSNAFEPYQLPSDNGIDSSDAPHELISDIDIDRPAECRTNRGDGQLPSDSFEPYELPSDNGIDSSDAPHELPCDIVTDGNAECRNDRGGGQLRSDAFEPYQLPPHELPSDTGDDSSDEEYAALIPWRDESSDESDDEPVHQMQVAWGSSGGFS